MPTVNTLVVDRADLLGLGQLHQLRGRVGRAGQRAYAYLFHPRDRALTEEAYERLRTIGETTELGSGFKIAMRDLEIRGAGNLLGESQSGHIAAVGLRPLLPDGERGRGRDEGRAGPRAGRGQARRPGRRPPPRRTTSPKEELRLEAYRRLAAVTDHAEVDDIRAEWEDRYGPVPAAGRGAADGGPAAGRVPSARPPRRRRSPGPRPAWHPCGCGPARRCGCAGWPAARCYKEDLRQLVVPLPRGADPATFLVGLPARARGRRAGNFAGVNRALLGAGALALALVLVASACSGGAPECGHGQRHHHRAPRLRGRAAASTPATRRGRRMQQSADARAPARAP